MTPQERDAIHTRQKEWVGQSLRLAGTRQERRDELAVIFRLYPRGTRVDNVVPLHPRKKPYA